ncbi:BrnT family toxin [Aquamicrobium sp. NLF2-7]|jgi:hypothetical protein|uniref:BrnT family toxin n=1 Tax=Aquamicrobium sp. NLF2-7 TaxID=2918753 RepID=UPI001EFA9C7B|nr:BrnT family toxin [Aquamicrobium sp. NLF2-7]MCG8271015.1 BrnT family toxin [Aquamicrobium sp. NLF2-7]
MRIVERQLFVNFEWDDNKARSNVEKHGISFEDAALALTQPHLEHQSIRGEEQRVLAICPASRRIIAVIYTIRHQKCRIISARAARENEKRAYRLIFPR